MRYLSVALVLSTVAGFACTLIQPNEMVVASAKETADDKPAGGQWGTVKGQIVWAGGEMPTPKQANVNKDEQHCLSKGPIVIEDWVINKNNKGIRWVAVWLAPDPPGADAKLPIHPDLKEIKIKEVVMDQPCCKFEPHLLGLRQGQALLVKNSAPIPHNVNWQGLKNPGDNKLVPPGGSIKIDNLKPAAFPVNVACNIHGWMKAFVHIYDHPYYTVTDENGQFEIKLAPAGKCRLGVWQESIGWKGGDRNGEAIAIKAGGVTDLGKIELKSTK